ncbi:hypothetical protein QN277_023573 [Acacia crassicarpa]|uniref:Uncharacterized protein n=1 Tax=Acacia crassicarpa TaxID=499986 RepID=A0AAE1MN58_9FABA|nr:hypothetical protein QN277_023573 [Acacia crassicarpa]
MASNDHTTDSSSGSPASEYEKWKQHIIDIENEPKDLKTTEWNIYKVPFNLRKLNEEAYTPQSVSIGPIHRGLESLNPMQEQKLRYLKLFWSHCENKTKDMDKFKEFLEVEERNIRECYAEKLCDKFEREELVMMMLLDSVFIMELFLRTQNVEKQTDPDDIIVKQSWLNKSIQRDLLLLENQIPFLILEKLYSTFVPDFRKKKHATFIELASDYFACYHNEKCDEERKSSPGCVQIRMNCGTSKKGDSTSGEKTGSSDSKGESPKHFTDLIRSFNICKDDPKEFKERFPLKNATKLRESGVSFEKVDNRCLVDIKFKKVKCLSWFLCLGCMPNSTYLKARLEILELKVDNTTECVLRNLIAFEQCHYPTQPYICNYVSFIDSLIQTKDDVELLVEKEVIMHELGSDREVATLVNGLCKHVVTDKTCYADIIDSLNKHYKRRWYRTMAILRLVYFRDAWRGSSTVIGIIVLILTIINFCRIFGLFPWP